MSRSYSTFDSQGIQSNFGVVNRGSVFTQSDIFLDRPKRSGVVLSNTLSAVGNIPISYCQNDIVTISASGTYTLPSAQDLLQAFNNINVGSIVTFEVVNKSLVGPAVVTAPAGSGAAAGLVDFTVPISSTTAGVRRIHLEFTQVNGSNTGTLFTTPTPLVATGAYLLY